MAVRPLVLKDGRTRWVAMYEASLPGQPRSRRTAGTFDTQAEAVEAARVARGRVLNGESLDFSAETTVGAFVGYFLATHMVGARTRAGYDSVLNGHILWYFGGMRFSQLTKPSVFKLWRAELVKRGVKAPTIAKARSVLSALVTAAIEEGCLDVNHARSLKGGKVTLRTIRIMTVEEFDRLHAALGSEARQLYLEVAIETGMRPGELMALTPRQCDADRSVIVVDRAVAVPGRRWSDSGDRFDVHDYTKTGGTREVEISREVMNRLWDLIRREKIGKRHILFGRRVMGLREVRQRIEAQDLPEGLGAVEGTVYRHGTPTGYTHGKCRCDWCRQAHREAARGRRAVSQGSPWTQRPPERDVTSPESWRRIFHAAVEEAGLDLDRSDLSPRHMRHTHSSWLHDAGIPTLDVMARLGHKDPSVAKRYRQGGAPASAAVVALQRKRHSG